MVLTQTQTQTQTCLLSFQPHAIAGSETKCRFVRTKGALKE